MKVKYLILGAGPTGLAAAYRLKELGEDSFLILEKDNIATGLCRSYKTPEGFKFDTAGHIMFSKRQRYYDFVEKLGVKLKKHKRNTYIWLFNRWIPYPLQNNVGHFPTDKAVDALAELARIEMMGAVDRSNFAKYLTSSFGKTLADNFLLPYNSKVWATSPAMMSTDWMGDRVSTVDFKKVLHDALDQKTQDDWGPNNIFFYPESGAFEDIFLAMIPAIGEDKILYSQSISEVMPDDRKVRTEDGKEYEYENLITTIPLDLLLKYTSKFAKYANGLRHNQTVGVGIGYRPEDYNFELEDLQPVCWLYFPQPEIPFYRVTQLSNYSNNGSPKDTRSWLAELSFESDATDEYIQSKVKEVIPSLKLLELLSDDDEILSFDWHVHRYGYPVPTEETEKIRKEVLPLLESAGIYSRGRFGNWAYCVGNSDHAVLQGLELVDRLLLNKTEEVKDSKF